MKEALARGATAHTRAKHDGQIYYPTILTDVPLDAAIANEETFGPVVVAEVVDTPEEAIAAANRAMNSPTVNDEIHAPMGGVRDSGWGRT